MILVDYSKLYNLSIIDRVFLLEFCYLFPLMMTFKMILTLNLLLSFAAQANASFTTEKTQVVTQDGQLLHAIWTIPQGPVKSATLILQGSGNVDKDGDVSGPMVGTGYHGQEVKLSVEVAEALAASGVASLRYSKRGVDDASQKLNQKFPYLLDDAASAFKMIQVRFPQVKSTVVGFSEGGLVAALLSTTVKVDGLFLLAPALRPIDQWFGYQFVTWPVEVLKKGLPQNSAEAIPASAFAEKSISVLPAMGRPWSEIDFNHDQQVSVIDELIPAYQGFYAAVRGLLATPDYAGWYESIKVLPTFPQYASSMKASVIHVYQGMDDAQMNWQWIVEDQNFFPVKPSLHLYPHLGHCFSPMDGAIGEVKTSGPFSVKMLDQLSKDFSVL